MSHYPEPTNLTGITGLFQYSSNVTDTLFAVFIPASLWIVIFMALKKYGWPTSDSFAAAGYLTILPSALLAFAGLYTWWHFAVVLLVCLALPLIWAYIQRDSY